MLRLLIALAAVSLAAQSSTEAFKQALTAKLLKLKPDGMTERNVFFQEVRAGAGNVFMVTALIRDYGPGYPRNRYYGETCVGRFDHVRFTLAPDGFGGWDVQGALTPPLDTRQCKTNPNAGVSSIPLSSLSGTQASAGAASSAAARSGSPTPVVLGSYECWANGEARMLLNFKVQSASQYTGSDGKLGSFGYSPANGRLAFHGGSLDGALPAGFFAIYYTPQGLPTVSFRSPGGNEAAFCQLQR